MKQKIFTFIVCMLAGITAVHAQTESSLSTVVETNDGWKVVNSIGMKDNQIVYTLWDGSEVTADAIHGKESDLPVVFNALYCVPGTLTTKMMTEVDNIGILKMFGKVSQDDINKIKNMSNITNADLSHLDMTDVTSLEFVFNQCSALERVDFGGNINSNVTNLKGMFYYCTNLTEVDFSYCDLSGATEALTSSFGMCSKLTTIKAIGCNEMTITLLQSRMTTLGYSNVKIITSDSSDTGSSETTE